VFFGVTLMANLKKLKILIGPFCFVRIEFSYNNHILDTN
jgi:hypothetical protein